MYIYICISPFEGFVSITRRSVNLVSSIALSMFYCIPCVFCVTAV